MSVKKTPAAVLPIIPTDVSSESAATRKERAADWQRKADRDKASSTVLLDKAAKDHAAYEKNPNSKTLKTFKTDLQSLGNVLADEKLAADGAKGDEHNTPIAKDTDAPSAQLANIKGRLTLADKQKEAAQALSQKAAAGKDATTVASDSTDAVKQFAAGTRSQAVVKTLERHFLNFVAQVPKGGDLNMDKQGALAWLAQVGALKGKVRSQYASSFESKTGMSLADYEAKLKTGIAELTKAETSTSAASTTAASTTPSTPSTPAAVTKEDMSVASAAAATVKIESQTYYSTPGGHTEATKKDLHAAEALYWQDEEFVDQDLNNPTAVRADQQEIDAFAKDPNRVEKFSNKYKT